MSKLTIDNVNDLTGWSITDGCTLGLNEYCDKISGINDYSLIAKFVPGTEEMVLTKTYESIDISEYETLILSMGSLNFGKNDYKDLEFSYSIKINDNDEFYLPINKTFNDINIAINDIDTLERIEITSIENSSDYIWLSEIVLEKQNVILDVMDSVKTHIEKELESIVGEGLSLGNVSGSTGDDVIMPPDAAYIEQYSVLLITDGTNSEVHQVDDIDHMGEITFKRDFDGRKLQHNYDNAEIKLVFPVNINPDERNIKLPGIVIWGFVPTPVYRTGKIDTEIIAYNIDGSFIQQPEGQFMTIPIQIDCSARQASLLDIAARAVRVWLEKEIAWINGRFHEIAWENPPIEFQPQTGIDIIPKVQYNLNIETQEIFGNRELVSAVTDTTLTISPGGN